MTVAEYIFIDRQHQFDLAITHLKNTSPVAIDTESSGYYTYFSDLCLIQISTNQYHYIIDVLNNLDLTALGKVLGDPEIEIIFHAASSDILELKRAYDWDVNNIFDTLLACRMISGGSCSLAQVVKNILGKDLEKKEQKSNWMRRPLTKSQLDYAHIDTLYLIQLRKYLYEKLKDLFLWDEFKSECIFMEKMAKPVEKDFNQDSYIKIQGVDNANPEIRGRVRALSILRDKVARSKNIASFRLISNDGIYSIAQKNPQNTTELKNLGTGNPKFIQKECNRIIKTIQDSQPIQDDQLPIPIEMNPDILRRLKKLKKTRFNIGKYRGMKPALIMGNKALILMATELPKDIETLEKMELMCPWKLRFYGHLFLRTLKGKPVGAMPEELPVLPVESRHE